MAQAHSQPTFLLYSGHSIPQLGLGTFKTNENTTNQAVASALQAGYRHINCAQHYMNEPVIGQALKAAFDVGCASARRCSSHPSSGESHVCLVQPKL